VSVLSHEVTRIGLRLGATVVVLVVFCILYLWMIWAYFKVR